MKRIKTTADTLVPKRLIDQVIGQDKAVDIIRKAARQKRHVLLIGAPGTGKSMLAQAMAELMEREALEDVLIYPNPNNENQPIVRVVRTFPDAKYIHSKALDRFFSAREIERLNSLEEKDIPKALRKGTGRRISQARSEEEKPQSSPLLTIALIAILIAALIFTNEIDNDLKWFILVAILGIGFLFVVSNATSGLGRKLMPKESAGPKLIVDNTERSAAPFIDATGSRAGSLLGDIKHDPLQSGGLGTPAHVRVEAGAIHQANKGVLFIDEIASLKLNWQQEILTAMQEKRYPITGQSEMSSGALVKTQPVPTDFVLVAAGNMPDSAHIHPALRSRIRGGGYEIFVEDSMEDTPENEEKIVRFIAQEVKKDGRIPHFDYEAAMEVVEEARRMAGRKRKLTLNLRELGGLIRAAGDIARDKGLQSVGRDQVLEARRVFKSIEGQAGARMIEQKKDYQMISNKGAEVGRVNGLAVLGDGRAGLVLPIVAEATPSASKSEGRVIATGKLGTIAKEAVDNVSAIFKKYIGTDIAKTDLHIQFLQTYEGVEGDSASISTAVAVISAVADVPVRQDVARTGSLDGRGKVLPVGGITGKIEAAIDAGMDKVLIPKANEEDVYLSKERAKGVRIVPVSDICAVLEHALEDCEKKRRLIKKFKAGSC